MSEVEVTINNRFGCFAANAADVVTFPDGLPGFETCRHFLVVSAAAIEPFVCLQGLDGAKPSFLAIDPRLVVPAYDVPLAATDRARLEAESGTPLLWLSLVRIDGDETTVNLRAPVVVNPQSMTGLQAMSAESSHPLDFALPRL